MQIDINEKSKLVSVWMSHEDSESEELNELYEQAKQLKYKVAVFWSGDGDLVTDVEKLLSFNLM